ncbi:MAG TPA: hypothetical protein VK004_03140, partial [Ignavibacteria bacterium]|nr:hypothetical protein [Ignavibacteria bacterium]
MKHSRSSQDSGQTNKMKDINKYWNALKKDDQMNSFYKTETLLKNASGSTHTQKHKIGIMIKYILAHKAKIAVIFFTVLLLAACNMPVTQNETLGHVIRWTVDNPQAGNMSTSLGWVEKNNLSINESSKENNTSIISYNLVLTNASLEQVQAYSKELESIPGVVEVNIMPLTEEVERPLYSKVLDDLFKININAKNMSDQELSAEVERQLKEGGIEVQTVNFRRDENNRRLIDIKMSEDGKPGSFQLNINDGDQKMRIEERRHTDDQPMQEFDIKGKSDDEIR